MPTAKQFTISKRDIRRLHGRAYRAQQKDHSEVCGALILDGTSHLSLEFIKNSSDCIGSFAVSHKDIVAARSRARQAGHRVAGAFHSHPVGYAQPGPRDIELAPLNSLMLIYDVCGLEARLWRVPQIDGTKRVQERELVVLDVC